jgi:hypothetical protein
MNANTATAEPTATAITEPAESAIDGRRVVRAAVVWVPGVAVALGAAVATAHVSTRLRSPPASLPESPGCTR